MSERPLLCPVIGCECERFCKSVCEVVEGIAPRKAEHYVGQWCFRCETRVEWKRMEDGRLRILIPPRSVKSTAA